MYRVSIDLDHHVIDAVLGGFFSVEEVEAYVKDVQTALILNQFFRGYSLVVDVADCPIQAQDALEAMRRHMAAMPKAQRIAVVVGTSPVIGQVRRLFTQDYARLVPTRAAALAWVRDGIDPRLSAAA